MSGPIKDFLSLALPGGCCCFVFWGLISIIVTLASIKTLGPDDQVVVEYLNGKAVVNGPVTKIFNPFRDKLERPALKLTNAQYVRMKNTLTGEVRMVEGNIFMFMEAYDTHDGIKDKIVVKQDEFIRFVDRVAGTERVVRGAASVVPRPWEDAEAGVEKAVFVDRDAAVLTLNKNDGSKRLVQATGPFIPDPYEEILETRTRIRLLPHEAMVVRNSFGRYIIHSGAGVNGTGSGVSYFLGPADKVVEMEWSTFSEPAQGGRQEVSTETVTRIDLRVRKVFFQYDVRTNDNVAMRIEGSIYWKVVDIAKLLNVTGDPSGDVWYKARSTLIAEVSKVDLETFMESFNSLIKGAFDRQASDSFYADRGVQVRGMQVSKYDSTDAVTAQTLRTIIEETTNRINRLQAQRSENDVKAAKLMADIALENERTTLIRTQAWNERLEASLEGESEGVQLAYSVASFVTRVNASANSVNKSVSMYKLHKKLENQNQRTKHIASGRATLFLTAEQLNMESHHRTEL